MKAKKTMILFFIALPVLIFGRFMQLFSMTEPSTGFFKEEFLNFNIFLSVFTAIILLIIVLMALLKKDYPSKLKRRSPALGAVSVVFAFLFLIYSAKMLTDGSVMVIMNDLGYSDFSVTEFIYMIMCVLCAVAFCIFGINNLTDFGKGNTFMAIPVLFWIYRLIYSFINYTGIANISENVIEIIMISVSLVFLLAQGKVINNIDYQKNIRISTGFGLAAALLCGVSTVPRYLLFLIGRSDLIHEGVYGNPIDLMLIVYILFFLFTYVKEAPEAE